MAKRVVIAIDGPAGAGKSTIARAVARKLGFVYINTGAMYRAVALWAQRLGVSDDDMHRLEQLALEADVQFVPGTDSVLLNGEDVTAQLHTPEVAAGASKVSSIPAVRRALVDKQRQLAGGASVVMEGRDIGTVVFPDAAVKLFLDADPAVRARRRAEEMGKSISMAVAEELAKRDERDRTRAASPLMQAPDAVYLDTSDLSLDEVESAILKLVRDRTTNGKEVAR
ncbi:MAG TPA: (d)CMP kinase [Bryobacteraceae bacterium]|nr:(d)CMP kinase [Bryobacteraceae bacterium]